MTSKKFFAQPVLVFSFVLAIGLAATEAPLWVSGFAVLVFGWKWLAETQGAMKPRRTLTNIISLFLFVQVFLQYRSVFTQEASNTLLVGLSALKILDYENDRDHKFLILLGFIMVSMKFIFNIDIYWIVPSVVAMFGLWYSLIDSKESRRFRFLFRMLVSSVPLTVILFFAFPRIIVPWAMKNSQRVNTVGFSDGLDPGSVSELASVDHLAFRAKFLNSVQSVNGLYWRGSVLTQSEGFKWRSPGQISDTLKGVSKNVGVRYQIVLEPTSRGFLFTLDFPKSVSGDNVEAGQYRFSVFKLETFSDKAISYTGVSDLNFHDSRDPDGRFLDFPDLPPKTNAWVNEITSRNLDVKSRLNELNRLFKESDFVYTLSPGTYRSENAMDEFLFDRKKGFCEHFAGSYATLARALGVPSRVITGYQGGSYNVFGNFWRVSQRDAHAWVEIYMDGAWQRVDPTQWVAPLRIALGGQEFFGLSEEDQVSFAKSTTWRGGGGEDFALLEALGLWVEDINYQWTHFMLEFDSESQRNLLSSMLKEILAVLVMIVFLIFTGPALFRRFNKARLKRDLIEVILDDLIIAGKKRGIRFETQYSPLYYISLVGARYPELKEKLDRFSFLYEVSVYGQQPIERKEVISLHKELKINLLNTSVKT